MVVFKPGFLTPPKLGFQIGKPPGYVYFKKAGYRVSFPTYMVKFSKVNTIVAYEYCLPFLFVVPRTKYCSGTYVYSTRMFALGLLTSTLNTTRSSSVSTPCCTGHKSIDICCSMYSFRWAVWNFMNTWINLMNWLYCARSIQSCYWLIDWLIDWYLPSINVWILLISLSFSCIPPKRKC